MLIEKREGELKEAYWGRFEALYPISAYCVLHHQDVRKSGHPDDSLHGFGTSSYWEFKHATPNFSSPGIQELTCRRLAVRAHSCLYVVFYEYGDWRRTLILTPNAVFGKHGKIRAMLDEAAIVAEYDGFDFDRLAHFMHSIHKPS